MATEVNGSSSTRMERWRASARRMPTRETGADAASGTARNRRAILWLRPRSRTSRYSRPCYIQEGGPRLRRDGRVAEGARLESVFRGNSNVGSNPTLSAITFVSLFRFNKNNKSNKISKCRSKHPLQSWLDLLFFHPVNLKNPNIRTWKRSMFGSGERAQGPFRRNRMELKKRPHGDPNIQRKTAKPRFAEPDFRQ